MAVVNTYVHNKKTIRVWEVRLNSRARYVILSYSAKGY